MRIVVDVTERQAEYLEAAACEFYHKMKESHQHEIFGAYITNEKVIDALTAWLAVEARTQE